MTTAPWGVLLVDKPEGPTSHDVVASVRRVLDTRKIGHTGTLDPLASGLLVLVVGAATRLSAHLTGLGKAYRAEVRLGVSTDTLDREGEVVGESEAWRDLDRADVEAALAGLTGEILQRPPAFSAKKVGGESAHRRARRGESVELEAVPVTVHALELDEWEPPRLALSVECSSGTYVRALARDLGEALGVGAHLTALRRTRVGPFRVEDAVAPEAVADVGPPAWLAPDRALEAAGFRRVELDADGAARLRTGQAVELPEGAGPHPAGDLLVAVDAGGFVALVEARGRMLRPRKVFPAAGGVRV